MLFEQLIVKSFEINDSNCDKKSTSFVASSSDLVAPLTRPLLAIKAVIICFKSGSIR
jgi:hypothetical protein